jgi:hypothetical protein
MSSLVGIFERAGSARFTFISMLSFLRGTG